MHDEWSKGLWGLGFGVVALLTLSGPLMRFTDPAFMSTIGMWTATAVTVAHYWLVLIGVSDKWKVRAALVPLVFVVFVILLAQRMASIDSRANDARCLAIQNDMLSARPRRSDGPDLFQALQCRPQGEGSVYAQPLRATAAVVR